MALFNLENSIEVSLSLLVRQAQETFARPWQRVLNPIENALFLRLPTSAVAFLRKGNENVAATQSITISADNISLASFHEEADLDGHWMRVFGEPRLRTAVVIIAQPGNIPDAMLRKWHPNPSPLVRQIEE